MRRWEAIRPSLTAGYVGYSVPIRQPIAYRRKRARISHLSAADGRTRQAQAAHSGGTVRGYQELLTAALAVYLCIAALGAHARFCRESSVGRQETVKLDVPHRGEP